MRVPAEDLFHRYLITGGTGFIGSNLVRSLVVQGKEVHLLVRPGSSLWRIDDIKQHVRCWVGDLQDRQSLVDCVGSAQPQVIVHLGGGSMGRPWDLAKGFDNSALCGALHPVSEVGHPEAGAISLSVNGTVRQKGDLAEMIWSLPEVISILSRTVTLAPGDLIYTGTPAGVGALVAGDRCVTEVAGLSPAAFAFAPPAA